jgi:molybdenum cofactor cytidylyltransferase
LGAKGEPVTAMRPLDDGADPGGRALKRAMIAATETVLVLLAAGRSERWGQGASKLEESFLGRPLGLHAATALAAVPFLCRIAVTGRARLDFSGHGFEMVPTDDPAAGLAYSVRLGVKAAAVRGAAAVLLALADMPRVTAAHVRRLFEASEGPGSVVCSSDGRNPCPPALFGRDRLDFLCSLAGDAGARALLRAGRHVVAAPAELIDIDTPAELERLKALVHAR